MTNTSKKVIFRLNEMSVPIQTLTRMLTGRTFDFQYILSNDGCGLVTVSDQKLLTECPGGPIRLEKRGPQKYKREYLVFVVEDPDDLLISVSGWNGALEIEISSDNKQIIITNHDGDWYSITVHNGKNS